MNSVKRFARYCWQSIMLALLLFSALGAYAQSLDGVLPDALEAQPRYYKPGDLIQVPIRKGNYVMLLWGQPPVWYDEQDEWFHNLPIRNYGTVMVQVPRRVQEGDYQLIEIDAVSDPRNLDNWRWAKENKIRIQKCDGFTICY